MTKPAPEKQEIAEVFDAYAPAVATRLRAIRGLILECAEKTDGVGAVVETLKWGQPSYLTEAPKSGTTIRIDGLKNRENGLAVYFHCGTDMVETCRKHYPDAFDYEGNRALRMSAKEDIPEDALRHCIQLALTYHTRRRKAAKAA